MPNSSSPRGAAPESRGIRLPVPPLRARNALAGALLFLTLGALQGCDDPEPLDAERAEPPAPPVAVAPPPPVAPPTAAMSPPVGMPAVPAQVLPDFANLAAQVMPAVVSIAVTSEAADPLPPELRGSPYERFFRDRFRGRRRPLVVGAGSGFIVDSSGIIVTNNHVVGEANSVVVSFQNGAELPARVLASDELTDLAVLKVDPPEPLPHVVWGPSAALQVGQWVLAVGNPFGLGGSATSGIVSALGREIGAGPFDDFIQTDAPINPGNSGGPLFNMRGEVVGINTAIYSPTGAYAGIGFAVPSDLARTVVAQLARGRAVERGWLGAALREATPAATGAPGRGVVVAEVVRGSPAARAGLRAGDVVVAVNGEAVASTRELVRSIAATPPGQEVQLSLVRNGRATALTIEVGRRPALAE